MAKLKILVVGGGGREHALCWRLARSPSPSSSTVELHAAPGNPGIAALATTHAVAAEDVAGLVELARRERYDLVVVGPEKPLALGLADALGEAGVAVFGCSRAAAEIESSKSFAKSLMQRHGVPTAEFRSFTEIEPAIEFARGLLSTSGRVVVKADGLYAGKGVSLCESEAEAAEAARRLMSSGRVVVEEFLVGREASCMAFVDGERVWALPACEDHKTIYDGDRGPMTGGMGAISPTPVVDEALLAQIEREVLRPTARALVEEGRPFRGLLYAGLMLTDAGPKVLEFNCRFGDPETEALLPRLRGDFAEALLAVATGREPRFDCAPEAACTVILAARGYPGTVEKGAAIDGLTEAQAEAEAAGGAIFHAGTKAESRQDGARLLVDGGRVLAVTALGADLEAARENAYRAVEKIHFDGRQYRTDIGARR